MSTQPLLDWRVERVRLRLELAVDAVRVRGELDVESTVDEPTPLVLDGRGLETLAVAVDGHPVDLRDERRLEFALSPGRHTVVTEVVSVVGRPGDKGFVFHEGLLSTNLEPEGFRRVTWYPDRPAIRAPFDVELVADPTVFPVVLSNGEATSEGVEADGRRRVVFSDPVPKPSYLFSMVAGDLRTASRRHVSASGRDIRLTVAAPPKMIAGADFALWAMDEMMTLDELSVGVEHDLPELTFVAIPGYPDATEYHGLMFFDPNLLIADPADSTDDDLLLVMANVAHEYGHHVRGNRVTVSSWDQLALKEGLTVLTAQNDFRRHLLGESARILDVFDLRRLQFPEEATMAAPVVREPGADPSSLYTRTTYLKGAEIFGMLRTMLGAERWQSAFGDFVHRHDLGAASVNDFLAAARDAAPEVDVDGLARWFRVAGRPRIELERTGTSGDSGNIRLTVRRTDSMNDDPPLSIPIVVGFVSPDGGEVDVSVDGSSASNRATLVLDSREATHDLAAERPFVVSAFRGYSAPVDIVTDHSDDELAILVQRDIDPFVRWWASEESMIRAVDAHRRGDPMSADRATDRLADVLRGLLRQVDDPLLLSQLLALPDEHMLGDREPRIDVDGVARGLAALRRRLGSVLADDLAALVGELLESADLSGSGPSAIARRLLLEPAFALLVAADADHPLVHRALGHREHTVALRAFAQIAHSESVPIDAIADEMFERCRHSSRLVDRWIRAQTGARRTDTIERVERFVNGPLYDRDDRPRVMAVWFPFATRNRSVFHHESGRGYRVFVDELGRLMPEHSGTAVRLVGDLLQFQRFDERRSALLRVELERLAALPDLPDFAGAILRQLLGNPAT